MRHFIRHHSVSIHLAFELGSLHCNFVPLFLFLDQLLSLHLELVEELIVVDQGLVRQYLTTLDLPCDLFQDLIRLVPQPIQLLGHVVSLGGIVSLLGSFKLFLQSLILFIDLVQVFAHVAKLIFQGSELKF